METQDSLKDGADRGYFTPDRVSHAQGLAERSIQCSTKLIVYLKGCRNSKRRKQAPPPPSNDERKV